MYLKHEPADFVATFNLACCFQRRGERVNAIQTLEHALILKPDDLSTHLVLAEAYKVEGNLEQAYKHARQALDLAPDDPNIYLFFFRIAHFCGHEEEATQVLQDVPTRFPEYEQLKIVGIEEAKEIFASSREYYQQIKSFYQEGNLPLALAAKLLNRPFSFTWHVFCNDKDWPILSASGNFDEQQQSYITAAQAKEVVLDYAALCTLYYLDLLDLPPKLFDKIFLAQGIFDQIQEDIVFLTDLVPPHRLERLEAISDIVYRTPNIQRQAEWLESSLILSQQQAEDIRPFREQDILLASQHNALYLLDDARVFSSIQQILPGQVTTTKRLLDYFYQGGKWRQIDYEQACDHLRKTYNLHDFGTEAISQFETIIIDYLSLEILFETKAFPLLITKFSTILVSSPTVALLNQNIGELKFYQATLNDTKKIEAAIKGCYIPHASIIEDPDKYPDLKALDSTFTETFVVADQLNFPIWTDDLTSRKLVGSGEWGQTRTFNTRTILELALNKKVLTQDDAFAAILNLLRWNYQFTPINAALIFWSIQQRNFQFNDDSELLFLALDKSVTDAYQGFLALIQDMKENTDPVQFEKHRELLFHNESIYTEVITHLWDHIPDGFTSLRTKWTIYILTRAANAVSFSSFQIYVLIILCIARMLRVLNRVKLGKFLLLCTNQFALSFLPEDTVDSAIMFIFARTLYNKGKYDEQMVQAAAKLLDSLRYAQYWRIQEELQRLAATNAQFKDFYNAVRAERYKKSLGSSS
ncbi:MAG: hypothetical protein BroJett011_35910 [Chloroflexota bacterium]|nr:MAG: hypothetical protein BroJett011_35910 [Chloroflexota bacterium]